VPKAVVWQLLAASQIAQGSSSAGSLGNAHRLQGDYDEAIHLQKSLATAKKIANQTYVVSVLNNLGNTYASLAKRDYRRFQFANQADDQVAAQKFTQVAISYDGRAVKYFETSLALARTHDPAQEIRSLLNLVLSYHRSRQTHQHSSATPAASSNVLHRLPDSAKAYAAIRLANLLQLVALDPAVSDTAPATQCLTPEASSKAVELLHQAGTIAQHLRIDRLHPMLWVACHVYECRQDYEQALKLTQQAQLTGSTTEPLPVGMASGAIFKAQGKTRRRSIPTTNLFRLKSIGGILPLPVAIYSLISAILSNLSIVN